MAGDNAHAATLWEIRRADRTYRDPAYKLKTSTDLEAVLADPAYPIFFDASGTLHRARFVEMAAAAGKAIYCEKPTAVETAEALRLALREHAGLSLQNAA